MSTALRHTLKHTDLDTLVEGLRSSPLPDALAPQPPRSTSPAVEPAVEDRAVTPAPRPLGKVIALASPTGGTGKTTLTLNLAAYMGQQLRAAGKKVCLLDMNFSHADTGMYLNQYTPNIIDVVTYADENSVSREHLNEYLVHTPHNFSALLAPATVMREGTSFVTTELYEKVLGVLTELYDYVFVDVPTDALFGATFSPFLIAAADHVIVPVTPALTTLSSADAWLREVTAPESAGGSSLDRSKVGYVLNRAQEGIDCSPETVREELSRWTFMGMIPETKEWKLAANRFELIATKGFEEIDDAFARILYAATAEPALESLPSAGRARSRT